MGTYFGTDGIRFIVDETALTTVKKVAVALRFLRGKPLIIGRDTRASGEEILTAFLQYYTSGEVRYVGEISTPGICYLSWTHRCTGIMITASHNPSEYNGLKFFDKGNKLSERKKKKIEARMEQIRQLPKPEAIQKPTVDLRLKEEYFRYLHRFLRPVSLRIGFDFANGSLSSYGEEIVSGLNPECLCIHRHPDGTNINRGAGALHPEEILSFVQKNDLDYGFTFDGDADRVLLCDRRRIYTGDDLMYLLSSYFELKKNTIVITPYSNPGLTQSLRKQRMRTLTVPNGDQNILRALKKKRLSLGGEDAGHLIIPEYLPTGDGLLNAIILSRILNQRSIQELLKGYHPYPYRNIRIPTERSSLLRHPSLQARIAGFQKQYKEDLTVHMRMSGTEKLLRLYVCHPDASVVAHVAEALTTELQLARFRIKACDNAQILIDEESTFGANVTLRGNVTVIRSSVGADTTITSSIVRDSSIGSSCNIGPFSNIHNESAVGNSCRIGNYAEIKHSSLGDGTKIAHLTYVGDCTCGKNVNFGCGSVTVNYDGKSKYETKIGDNVFIGCNVNLIAPIAIGDNAFIAAGSTITKSLEANDFAIARSRETIKEGKAVEYPYYKGE